jgi:hypothetical protein
VAARLNSICESIHSLKSTGGLEQVNAAAIKRKEAMTDGRMENTKTMSWLQAMNFLIAPNRFRVLFARVS